MNKISKNIKMKSLKTDQRGAGFVEYMIITGVVALMSITAFSNFQDKVKEKLNAQGETVGQINSGKGN